MLNRFCFVLLCLGFSPALFGQDMNRAAVDTLTKDVAIAVFEKLSGPKAQEIYGQLLSCGNDCDAQTIIRQVGSWDQVGSKLEEIALIRDTERFQKMTSAEANVALRKQLDDFYTRHRAEKPYSVPLTPAVRANMIAKIDAMLPPNPADTTAVNVATPDGNVVAADSGVIDENGINLGALERSQLERLVKEEKDKQIWMMLIGGLVGLIVGALAAFLLVKRSARAEIEQLVKDNNRLSAQLDQVRRNRPANVPLPPRRTAERPEIDLEKPAPPPESPTRNEPVDAEPPIRSAEPAAAPATEPAGLPPLTPLPPLPPLTQTQAPTPSNRLYFPPPSPDGLFDGNQQATSLLPESAYLFTISPENPDFATFRFEAEPGRVARFLTYRNYMIEPACDSENSYSSQYTRIVNLRDGEAVRENGGWRVTTKATIRYE